MRNNTKLEKKAERGLVYEAVSKPQIAVEGKARADEKAEHTR
jgi:hypothetical protein